DTDVSQSQNPEFQKALATEYKKIALFEADQMYDTLDGGHFADKGLRAHAGQKPLPESPANWNLEFGQQRLEAARKRLTALMARDAANRSPQLAAAAQANFDCWVEQMEEGWQWDHIEYCQNNFQKNVIALEKLLATPTRVGFNINEAHLTEDDTIRVLALGEEAIRMDAPLVSVVGYTDRTGSKKYNLNLSLARADEVAAILRQSGYPKDRIAISAYGEDRPVVATADGISAPENRRVEILFYPNIKP
ncbi:MAG: OmpA family protein, partial [Alphaproteobacteria bacterium]|nr:OmpA family protein [Alphaproteobacteria bacterium]